MKKYFSLIIVLLLYPVFSAKAYIDPGVGSMFVQLLAAGIAGFLALFKIFYKRNKRNKTSAVEKKE